MKRITTALTGLALFAAMAVQPLSAQQSLPSGPDIQVAETPLTSGTGGTTRNIPALVRRDVTKVSQENDGKTQPPGTQALMVLGIALIVSPAMFRGAFSN